MPGLLHELGDVFTKTPHLCLTPQFSKGLERSLGTSAHKAYRWPTFHSPVSEARQRDRLETHPPSQEGDL